jgi:hypothetical protein
MQAVGSSEAENPHYDARDAAKGVHLQTGNKRR